MVIGALLPIVITLLLGYFAGWHHDFGPDQASVLNRMVMLYALPLSLFSGIVGTSRDALTSDIGATAAIWLAMLLSYAIAFAVARYLFRFQLGRAALIALAVGAPSVPFVGTTVLEYLFGASTGTILVAAGALPINAVLVPVSLILLSVRRAASGVSCAEPGVRSHVEAATAASGARDTHPSVPDHVVAFGAHRNTPGLRSHIAEALREPVVWAPIAGVVLVLAGVPLPSVIHDSLALLGSATGAVALFASGIVLYAQKVTFSRSVGAIVLARNVLVPSALWAVLWAITASPHIVREAVITLAIPVASVAVILAVQYQTGEREQASSLLFSTVLSVLTLGAFILLT